MAVGRRNNRPDINDSYRKGMMNVERYYIGVDLGGTKIKAIAIDNQGTVFMKRKVPTDGHLARTP